MKSPITIIIPTWNNPQYFDPCVESIRRIGVLNGLCRLIVINNGKQPIKEQLKDWPNTLVLEPGKNLGWERGLELGLQHTDSPFVVFQNDDTVIPVANAHFYTRLLYPFNDDNVAAVGPATTIAAGKHSIYQKNPPVTIEEVSYLIFFTVMVRRRDYDLAGGIDVECPGGDDIDLSIRLRKLGKKLFINPGAFLIHHAFKTGERVRGDSNAVGGWNSKEMTDKTNKFLIQKHGFKTYLETVRGYVNSEPHKTIEDSEGNVIRQIATSGVIYELGCGARKTVQYSIGLDRVPKGEKIPHVGMVSEADIVCDVTQPLPLDSGIADYVICRHILEHCVDSVQVLKEWSRILKVGGKLIIAVPNENIIKGIPTNPEHVHAFNPKSLKSLMDVLGFKSIDSLDPQNGISFVGIYEKVVSHETVEVRELVNA